MLHINEILRTLYLYSNYGTTKDAKQNERESILTSCHTTIKKTYTRNLLFILIEKKIHKLSLYFNNLAKKIKFKLEIRKSQITISHTRPVLTNTHAISPGKYLFSTNIESSSGVAVDIFHKL